MRTQESIAAVRRDGDLAEWVAFANEGSDVTTRHLHDIHVGARFRRDLGDIDALARSIAEIGLLHPVVVTPEGDLIAGRRRLEAHRKLGLADVPVTVVDLHELVRGEHAENVLRKDFTPSEAVAIGAALEEVERAARLRQRHPQVSYLRVPKARAATKSPPPWASPAGPTRRQRRWSKRPPRRRTCSVTYRRGWTGRPMAPRMSPSAASMAPIGN
jgi:hypothetical protein